MRGCEYTTRIYQIPFAVPLRGKQRKFTTVIPFEPSGDTQVSQYRETLRVSNSISFPCFKV
jgi:hypothetical protein